MLSLLRLPLTRLDAMPRSRVRVPVAVGADLDRVQTALSSAAVEWLVDATVSLVSADRNGLVYEVSGGAETLPPELLPSLVRALDHAGIALGGVAPEPEP
jgi:hypothetical protein